MDVHSNFVHNCQNSETSKMMPFGRRLDAQTVVLPDSGIVFSNKEKWAVKSQKDKRELQMHIIRFQLYDILGKAKVRTVVVGAEEGRGRGQSELRGFSGQWKDSVWPCRGGDVTWSIWQTLESVRHKDNAERALWTSGKSSDLSVPRFYVCHIRRY